MLSLELVWINVGRHCTQTSQDRMRETEWASTQLLRLFGHFIFNLYAPIYNPNLVAKHDTMPSLDSHLPLFKHLSSPLKPSFEICSFLCQMQPLWCFTAPIVWSCKSFSYQRTVFINEYVISSKISWSCDLVSNLFSPEQFCSTKANPFKNERAKHDRYSIIAQIYISG